MVRQAICINQISSTAQATQDYSHLFRDAGTQMAQSAGAQVLGGILGGFDIPAQA